VTRPLAFIAGLAVLVDGALLRIATSPESQPSAGSPRPLLATRALHRSVVAAAGRRQPERAPATSRRVRSPRRPSLSDGAPEAGLLPHELEGIAAVSVPVGLLQWAARESFDFDQRLRRARESVAERAG